MILTKCSSVFSAKIDLPASKSISNRWLILNACSEEKSLICNLSKSADTVLLQELLSKISTSKNSEFPIEIHCKNAGTVLRFLTAYLSVTPGKWVVSGDERLSVRPIDDLIATLLELGAEISYVNNVGCLPIEIVGKPEFTGNSANLNMTKSSQFATALMLMFSKFPQQNYAANSELQPRLQLHFDGKIISKPYLDMTSEILEQCGVQTICSEKNIVLNGDNPKLPKEIFVESDWSAASYFYAFVALSENGVVEFENLDSLSIQGDSIVANWFENFGVETIFTNEKTIIKKTQKPLKAAVDLDFTNYPDIAQTIAVLCAALNIPAKLSGLSSLRDKETDRLTALSEELNQLGVPTKIDENTLIIYQTSHDLNFSKPIKTYGDHRMAMAFSIFSARYNGVKIEDSEVVNKSFPNYWKQLNKLNTNQL